VARQPELTSPADPVAEEVDWDAIERSPEYRELEATKRRFILPATAGYLAAYFGFLVLAGQAPDFMGRRLAGGITVGFVLMGALFVVVWALVFAYRRVAGRDWDVQAARVIEHAGPPATPPPDGARTGPREAPTGRTEVAR